MRIGFSVDEVRRMDMGDFIAFTDVAFGEDRRSPDAMATQEDIDAFMG